MSIPELLEMCAYLCLCAAIVGATQLIPKFRLRSGVPAGEWDTSAGPDRPPRSRGPATRPGQTHTPSTTGSGSARGNHPKSPG